MFFATKETIPEGMGFSTFDATHLVWLGAIALFWVSSIVIYRKLNPEKANVMRIVLGSLIVLLEIFKDVVAAINGTLEFGHLPLHLCGINILLIAFDIFKPTKVVRSFLYYFCIPGALLALLFPNWTAMPCLNFRRINFATELLRGGSSVSETAFACGFNNLSYFTKVFKKYNNALPSKISKEDAFNGSN